MTVVFELPLVRHTTCSIVIIICYILYIYIPTLCREVFAATCNGKTTLGILYTLVGPRLSVFVIIIIIIIPLTYVCMYGERDKHADG